ncbi:MAG: PPC domain-containing protein [Cyanobacteria bacterium P01_F01_bin.150]
MNSDPLNLIELESNDTIATAMTVALSTDAPKAIATGSINFDFDNNRSVDATEDVDLYGFELAAGDTIKLDLDEFGDVNPIGLASITLFDSDGNFLTQGDINAIGPGPDDAFLSRLPYIEYTATEAGTYYVGVSAFFNGGAFTSPFVASVYNPLIAGSGNGFAGFPGLNGFGDYALNFELVNDETPVIVPPQPPGGEPPADAPTVSSTIITGTYDVDRSIILPALVESVSDVGLDPLANRGGSAMTVVFDIDGAIPSEGIEVVFNTDANLADYFLTTAPLVRGGEVLGPVLDAEGNLSGIRLNLSASTTVFNLNVTAKPIPETDGPEQVTFSLTSSAANISGESAEATVTLYDVLGDVPRPTPTDLTVGLTVENEALVEAEGNRATLTFTLSEPPPAEGTTVYVNLSANTAGIIAQGVAIGLLGYFDVFNAEITGGNFPVPDAASSGFYFNITEQIATISIAGFPDDVVEGVQAFQAALGGGSDYQVDPAASAVTVTLADTIDSLPQISLRTEPTVLIESEQTVSVHTFALSSPPPSEGIQVSVTATGIDEFDLSGVETTGITGDISVAESDPPQLIFTMTDENATINLPVANDGASEGLETATFTLNPSDDYQVDPIAASSNFQIVDTPDDIPASPFETELNDSLETAISINLSSGEPVTISGAANYFFDFRSGDPLLDFSEDVDLYSFNLAAGESIAVDVEATVEFDGSASLLKPVLRIFDANGSELDTMGQIDSLEQISAGPGEANLTFTAQADGTYYAGISVLGNDDYDPTVPGSGSGWFIEGVAEPGGYQVTFSTASINNNANTIDFDSNSLTAGDVMTSQIEGVTISVAEDLDAMIFDSANPTGGDKDLASDELGNILIISEDGDSTDPDDNAKGGTLMFDWDGVVNVASLGLLDIEEAGGTVTLYASDDATVLATINIPGLGNNSLQSLYVGTADVGKMDVLLTGSGAVTEIVLGDDMSVI